MCHCSAMSGQPYQLFYQSPPEGHTQLTYLAKALWRARFSREPSAEDDYLDDVYLTYSTCPEEASWQVCPYYFDKVTGNLWNYHKTRPRYLGCLCLCCFHSWSSLKEEISKAFLSSTEEKQNGVTRDPNRILSSMKYLSRLKLPSQ